jgi:multicomponent Na+:H+ antiporter subunit D
MIKIWNEAFLKKQPETSSESPGSGSLTISDVIPSLILGIFSILLGIFAGRFFVLCIKAAEQLIDPVKYIEAVLK